MQYIFPSAVWTHCNATLQSWQPVGEEDTFTAIITATWNEDKIYTAMAFYNKTKPWRTVFIFLSFPTSCVPVYFTSCTFDSQLLPLTAKHFRSNINKSLVHFTLLSWTFHFPILPLLYPIPFLFPFSPLPYQAHSTLINKKEFWW